jgi:hypothetical protein
MRGSRSPAIRRHHGEKRNQVQARFGQRKLPAGARYQEPKVLEMNQKDGTFCDGSEQAGPAVRVPRVSRGLAVGDLFNDGNVDVVVEDLTGEPMILKNSGVAGRHWVSFELQGSKSNRLAIGARLKLVAGGMTQPKRFAAAAVIFRRAICACTSA